MPLESFYGLTVGGNVLVSGISYNNSLDVGLDTLQSRGDNLEAGREHLTFHTK